MERRKYIWDCYAEALLICGCFTCCSNHKNCRLVFVCVLYLSFLCMHGAICFSLTKNTKDEICNLFITICISRKKVFLDPPNKPEKSTDCWYPKETCSFIQARHTVYTYFSLSYNILSLKKNRKNLKILQNVFWEIARFFPLKRMLYCREKPPKTN